MNEEKNNYIYMSIPVEIWYLISEKLSLKDLINFYKAYPFLINEKIYNYLPLRDKKFWRRGITSIINICNTCQLYHLNYISFCLHCEDCSADCGLKFDNNNLTYRKYWTLKNKTLIIQARSTIEICYKYQIKIPFNGNKNCSYHEDDFAYKIRDEIISLTEKKWCEFIDSKKKLHICSKCGDFGHRKYDKNCLLSSKKLRLKKNFELNQISIKKFREIYCKI